MNSEQLLFKHDFFSLARLWHRNLSVRLYIQLKKNDSKFDSLYFLIFGICQDQKKNK